jgi:hypothetical protein
MMAYSSSVEANDPNQGDEMATMTRKTGRLEAVRAELYAAADRVAEYRAACTEAARERFRVAGGCARCVGQGSGSVDYHDGDTHHWRCEEAGCTEASRARTRPLLGRTDAECEELDRLAAEQDRLCAMLDAERIVSEVRRNRMARVVKGRKVAKGDYRVMWLGAGRFGTRVGLVPADALRQPDGKWLDARGGVCEPLWTAADNCVGLAECPECGTAGTTDEVAWDLAHGLCGLCCDRAKEEGRVDW